MDKVDYNALNPNREERLSMMNRAKNLNLTGRMYMPACRSCTLAA